MMKKLLHIWIWGRNPRNTLLRAALLGIFCFFLFKYAIQPSFLDGTSMSPTYKNGELRFINRLAYRSQNPERGDVVAITTGGGDKSFYFKRILGLPGERVAFQQGRFLVNGTTQPEPYLAGTGSWNMKPVQLGPDEYFVAGDNRAVPLPRHLVGTVQRQDIRGRLLF